MPAMTNRTEVKQTYTVDEVAEILGVGRSTLYDAIVRDEIPVIRIGRRILISKAQLDEILSAKP